jgi:rod shape-determining protein MreD
MRLLVFALTVVANLIFTGAVFPNINILGVAPDIIVCSMASIAVHEKSMSGAAVGLICGLVLDIMFTGIIGFYSLPYFVAGAALYFVIIRFRYIEPVFVPCAFAMGAYLIKDLTLALLGYMLGRGFSLGHTFLRYMLPEMVFTGVLMLLIHLIYKRLYLSSSMRPKGMEDLKKLL